jgi:hypothetical protein
MSINRVMDVMHSEGHFANHLCASTERMYSPRKISEKNPEKFAVKCSENIIKKLIKLRKIY